MNNTEKPILKYLYFRLLEEIEEELMRSPVGEDMESVIMEKRELTRRLG